MKDIIFFSDEELMQAIKADNMFAFDQLYRKYSKKLFSFGYSLLKSEEETKNLIQDVYLSLWENRFKVEKESSVKYYLFKIAYNSSISILRKKAKECEFVEYVKSLQEITEEPVNSEAEYIELSNKVNEIINNLPFRQKEIFQLHNIEGLKYREISERLGISINTIETHMSRALKTVREKLYGNYYLPAIFFWYHFL